MTGKTVTAE
jgi:hypothetical protein